MLMYRVQVVGTRLDDFVPNRGDRAGRKTTRFSDELESGSPDVFFARCYGVAS